MSVVPYAEGCSNCWTNCEKAWSGDAEPPSASPHAIMMAPARKFSCLLMPRSRILAQSNPAGTSGSMGFKTNLYFCCACAEEVPRPSSARKAPARITNKAIKRRRLKNPPWPESRRTGADAEVECFFMVELHLNPRFLIKTLKKIKTFVVNAWPYWSLSDRDHLHSPE